MTEALAKARLAFARPAIPQAALLLLEGSPQELAKPEPGLPERLPLPPVQRLDPPEPASASPDRRLSIPWHALPGCERRLCFCPSNHKSSKPCRLLRVKSSNSPRDFSRVFLRNRFHAVKDQLLLAQLRRTTR